MLYSSCKLIADSTCLPACIGCHRLVWVGEETKYLTVYFFVVQYVRKPHLRDALA
jgi:hypothetical protein